jgi:hypothetical protein
MGSVLSHGICRRNKILVSFINNILLEEIC